MNYGLQVKSGRHKPNKQGLVNQTLSIYPFWMNLEHRKYRGKKQQQKNAKFFRLKLIPGMPFHILWGDNV